MKQSTANSWVNALAIMLLLNSVAAAFTGIIYLIIGIFVPAANFTDDATKLATIGIAVFALILAPLLFFWGKALWERKPWSRMLTIIAAVLATLLGIVLLVGSVAMMMGAGTDPTESKFVGVVLLGVTIAFLACCSAALWLLFRPEIRASFQEKQLFAWTPVTRALIVQAWAIIVWVSAAAVTLAGVLFMLLSPFVANLITSQVEVSAAAAIGIMIGIGALCILIGFLIHLVAKGLWNFRPWARNLMIFFAWISIAVAGASFILSLIHYTDVLNVADSLTNLLYAGLVSGAEIWFLFQARDLFNDAPKATPAKTVLVKETVHVKRAKKRK